MRSAAFILQNGINVLRAKENAAKRKSAIKLENMIRNGYKYIVRLTRDVELYLTSGSLSRYMIREKVKKGSERAKHAIRVARALGYNIRYKNGVYYDIDGLEMCYYEGV